MQPLDLFVGAVAIIFGLTLVVGAATGGAWLMSLAKPRLLAEAIGQRVARVVIVLLGIALIALGIAIARGWRVNWSG